MRFFTALVAGALAAVASAQTPAFTWIVPASLEVGQTYNVTYSSTSDAAVTIILRQGASNNLDTVTTLTSTATGGYYLWTVDKALPNGSDYALQIVQGSEINYSKQFIIAGSTSTGLSSSASGSASASASATASASGSASASSASITGSASVSASASASASASNSSVTLSVSGNSTIATTLSSSRGSASATGSTATGTRSSASSTGTASGAATAPTGAAANLKSPMALVFGAVAAMAYLH